MYVIEDKKKAYTIGSRHLLESEKVHTIYK